jgi:hypothetical protein
MRPLVDSMRAESGGRPTEFGILYGPFPECPSREILFFEMVPPSSRYMMEGFNFLVAFEHIIPHENPKGIGGMIHHVFECGIFGNTMIKRKV